MSQNITCMDNVRIIRLGKIHNKHVYAGLSQTHPCNILANFLSSSKGYRNPFHLPTLYSHIHMQHTHPPHIPSPPHTLPHTHSTLVNRGLLLVRDVGKACSWWFAIPGVSPFTRSYTKGKWTRPLCCIPFPWDGNEATTLGSTLWTFHTVCSLSAQIIYVARLNYQLDHKYRLL